ncbi:MAG: hypothetical protein ACOXZ4_03365 [Sphaerochaetaceae bacterium]
MRNYDGTSGISTGSQLVAMGESGTTLWQLLLMGRCGMALQCYRIFKICYYFIVERS